METFYSILQHAHSGLRWLVLLFLLIAIGFSLTKWIAKKPFWTAHKKWALLAFVFTHIQLLIGLILYFISPKVVFSSASMKDGILRFFLVEHSSLMLLATVLITIGYMRAKRSVPEKSAKIIFGFFTAGLLLILLGIPWPFRGLGTGWF